MAPATRLYLVFVLLACSTSFFLRSSAEDDESGWTTVRPEVRHLVRCGNTIYASIHRIQPMTLGGIKLRGATLFRLYGPQFQIHSLYRKSYDDFDSNGNVEGLAWVYSKGLPGYEARGADESTQLQTVTGATETGTASNIERESGTDREQETDLNGWATDSTKDEVFNSDWFQTLNEGFSRKTEEEGEDFGWGRTPKTDFSDLNQLNAVEQDEPEQQNPNSESEQQNPNSESEQQNPNFEPASVTLESNLRKAYEEAYRFRKSLDDAYFGESSVENVGRANAERRLDEYLRAPSDEILTDILHYVLIAFAFLAFFSLISLASHSHSVCSEDRTVFVVDSPDHSTPLLQTYVVSDTERETSVESAETEHGVVLYQPPPEIEKK